MQHHHHLLPGAGAGAGLPLPPRRALLVSADAEMLSSQDAILRERGYNEVMACTDAAAVMTELRGGHGFEVVLVHMCYPLYAPAFELLECAIGEMHVEAYAISNRGIRYGPLELKDLKNIRKDIYKEPSSGSKSPEATPNGPGNSSPMAMATTPTTTTLLISGRRETRRRIRRTRVSDTNSQELNVKNEQQKPPEKSKKARLVWTDELRKKFVEAHYKLLPGDAVPKKILNLMNDSTLTRENIASHLQKHTMNLDPLRRGDPKTKHQKVTPPQASLSSPNMSEQQVSPTMMQPLPTSNFSETYMTQGAVYINHNMSAQTTNKPPTVSDMQDSHPVMHMQPFKGSIYLQTESVFSDVASKEMYSRDNKSKQNSTWCPDLSHDNGLQEGVNDIVNKDPGSPWENKFVFSSCD